MFTQSTILITGASAGIGLELALALHARGNRIIAAARRTDRLDALVAGHPGMTAVRLDMADAADIRKVAGQIIADHPDLDAVIHNAGIMTAEALSATPSALSLAEDTVATNLLGPIRLTHALLPHLAGRPGSAIVTVSSGLAFVPLALTPTYSATKAAIHSWTQSLRHQLAGTGTRVIEIAPPAVQTDLMPGQATSAHAMPLKDFIAETMALLTTDPVPDEICVERVRFLREAEASGSHDKVFAMLNPRPR